MIEEVSILLQLPQLQPQQPLAPMDLLVIIVLEDLVEVAGVLQEVAEVLQEVVGVLQEVVEA